MKHLIVSKLLHLKGEKRLIVYYSFIWFHHSNLFKWFLLKRIGHWVILLQTFKKMRHLVFLWVTNVCLFFFYKDSKILWEVECCFRKPGSPINTIDRTKQVKILNRRSIYTGHLAHLNEINFWEDHFDL